MEPEAQKKGFLGALFDTSFEDLVTPRIIKVLYIISIVLLSIFTVIFVISSFAQDPGLGLLTLLVLAPLGFLFYLILIRVYLEIIIVLFKIKDATERMAQK